MLFKSIIYASALAALASAQSTGAITSSASAITSTATQEMPAVATQAFNIGLVNNTRKLQWCQAQRNTCPDICGGRVSANECSETDLTYNCVCSNGTIPDVTAFIQTIPFYECQETYAQCLANHPSTDPDGQAQCQANEQCPTRNATAERFDSESSSSSTSASSTGSSTGSSSASGASSTSSQAAAASITPVSTSAFVALLFAICKLVL